MELNRREINQNERRLIGLECKLFPEILYQDRKLAKESEREAIKMQIKALGGPDLRAIETDKMNSLLSTESLRVGEDTHVTWQ